MEEVSIAETFVDKAPIVLFVFNRPRHTLDLLTSLKANAHAAQSKLIVFAEAAAHESDSAAVRETKEVVLSEKWCGQFELIERSSHVGCRINMIDGITDTVSKYGTVIVLEDDLVLSPAFLAFMNNSLERYRDEPKVMHVSGYLWPIEPKSPIPESFFLKYAANWGWATWERAWKLMEPDHTVLVRKLTERGLVKEFCLNNAYRPMFNWLKDAERKDVWDMLWYASILLNDGLSLQSGHSLALNTGNDGSGIHSVISDIFEVKLSLQQPVRFPEQLAVNAEMAAAVSEWFRQKRPISRRIVDQLNLMKTRLLKRGS
jgi:hypothetical protein